MDRDEGKDGDGSAVLATPQAYREKLQDMWLSSCAWGWTQLHARFPSRS